MKKLIISAFILASLTAASCNKCPKDQCDAQGAQPKSIQVIKDCTGTYIRYQKKDYQVCNKDILETYNNGDWITAGFNKVVNCSTPPEGICAMAHEYDSRVEVLCIK